MTAHFIVIGNPIAHSKSPVIHTAFARQLKLAITYHRQWCPDNMDSFTAVVEAFFNGGGVGANVTVPFKQMAYELCQDHLTLDAQVAGAVNTLYQKDNQLWGDNTDGAGFVQHLQRLGWDIKGKKVAIIGAGGASRGILLPLLSAGVSQLHIANRTVSRAQALIDNYQAQLQLLLANNRLSSELMATLTTKDSNYLSYGSIDDLTGDYDIIINATSIGLSSNRLALAGDLNCRYAYDMMYGRELPFLQHFQAKGAVTSDGFGMLLGQAMLSFQRWTGLTVDMDNLVLDID